MFLKLLIFIIVGVSVFRTVTYSIWCFKNKNIIGAISVFLLAAIAAFSVIFII